MRKLMKSEWFFLWFLYLIVLSLTLSLSSCGGGGGDDGVVDDRIVDTTAPTATLVTPDGSIIMTTSVLQVKFSESMDATSLSATMGTTALTGTWSQTTSANDTVTFSGTYSLGAQTLTLDAKDKAGNSLAQLVADYTVFNALLYVSTSGNDTNDGTSAALPKRTIMAAINSTVSGTIKAVLVSGGTYTVDSNAGVGNQIVLVEGISLYGGYSANFTIRSVATNTTTITDVSTTAGDANNMNRAMQAEAGITSATVIDGFTINGSSLVVGPTAFTAAIYNDTGAAPTISNNTINGGSGGAYSFAVRNYISSPTISRNTINGGSGVSNSFAIYSSNGGAPVITSNIISGGSGTTSKAIENNGSSSTISNNTINGGDALNASFGVYNAASTPVISNNTIYGGNGVSTSYGVYNGSSSNPVIRNNTINGGSGASQSTGVHNETASPVIDNNTINGGSGGLSLTVYNVAASSPSVRNNILFTPAGVAGYCYTEGDATSDPTEFFNNDLFGCSEALYNDENTIFINDIVGVNALGTNVDNVSVDPSFVDQAGGDYHLTASSPTSVTQGGMDLSGEGITTDKDGAARTAPFSMGAYERN